MTPIMCDFDRATLPRDLPKRMALVLRAHRLRVETVCYTRTLNGWHVLIVVRGRVAFWRVVTIQALLGSDWKREMFNSRRAVAWRHVPKFWRSRANVFYKRHHKGVTL